MRDVWGEGFNRSLAVDGGLGSLISQFGNLSFREMGPRCTKQCTSVVSNGLAIEHANMDIHVTKDDV